MMKPDRELRIAYFISCRSDMHSGYGGHHRSLISLARALNTPYQVFVLGDLIPDGFEDLSAVSLIAETGSAPHLAKALETKVREFDLIHCYDNSSARTAMFISARNQIPLVVTKAGGAPWHWTTIPWRNIVVFQETDLQDLKSRPLAPKHIKLIPQRIDENVPAADRASPFRAEDNKKIKIICVSRFHNLHYQKIVQAINLGRALRERGLQAVICLVGYIHDEETYRSVCNYLCPQDDVVIRTDQEYTREASKLVQFADIVVASGRGFPEGLRQGKIMFAPVAQSDLPCMIGEENYAESKRHNFTGRAPRSETLDPASSLERYLNLSPVEKNELSSWALECFTMNHSAAVGARQLIEFYQGLQASESIWECYARELYESARDTIRRSIKKPS